MGLNYPVRRWWKQTKAEGRRGWRRVYYVYMLIDDGGLPFYIGKGSGGRATSHITAAVNISVPALLAQHVHIRSVLAQGGQVRVAYVYFTLEERDAYQYEAAAIAFHRNRFLLNDVSMYVPVDELKRERAASRDAAWKRRQEQEEEERTAQRALLWARVRVVERLYAGYRRSARRYRFDGYREDVHHACRLRTRQRG